MSGYSYKDFSKRYHRAAVEDFEDLERHRFANMAGWGMGLAGQKRSYQGKRAGKKAKGTNYMKGVSDAVMLEAAAAAMATQRPSVARTGGYSFQSTGGKELNFVDTSLTGVCNTTGQISLLNGMAQGTTASTRIGRQIAIKSIEFKMVVKVDITTILAAGRFCIVLDKQANASTAAITDIYDTITATALRNVSNSRRFWVIHDSGVIAMAGGDGASEPTSSSAKSFEYYKRITIPVQYNAGVAGTVGDIQTNALYAVWMGDNVAGATDLSTTGTVRLRYSD